MNDFLTNKVIIKVIDTSKISRWNSLNIFQNREDYDLLIPKDANSLVKRLSRTKIIVIILSGSYTHAYILSL
jgi:gamma-glutamyl phosphate reductase